MKVSLSWLRQYVSIDMPLDGLVTALTMAGLEVDSVADRYDYLDRVLVGRVVEAAPHPDADRLKVCRVDVGDRIVPVVCGAPNVRTGLKVPLALPGTVLPDGTVLGEAAIRGAVSRGMICSEIEIAVGPESAGIMELDASLIPGTRLAEALGLSDSVLEIDLTPNRPDCLSMIGVAREVAAIQHTKIQYPPSDIRDAGHRIDDMTSVTIEAPEHCRRYSARLITGVTVKPSPFWLQERLLSVGQRPINNIVDITNFVMLETGQPLHAFDFDRLAENRVVVRTADEGERFVTLDEKERTLTTETLMICDGRKPVGIGGVMGGLNSEISKGTARVLLESACFHPVSIRKTSKRLGLNTEATHRFERGVDPGGTVAALNRAALLIAELGGGDIVAGLIDQHPLPAVPTAIRLDTDEANRLLGTRLDREEMARHLEAIEFTVAFDGPRALSVTPPSFRVDVARPEDLMEEIARLSGYDRIPTTFPPMPAQARHPSRNVASRSAVRQRMNALGFTEAINYSFISGQSVDRLNLAPEDRRRETIEILNPLSEGQTVMRTSLLPGLVETALHNIAHQERNLRLFEIGRTYLKGGTDSPARETEWLAALWTGARHTAEWHSQEEPCDFFDIKGAVEGLLESLGVREVRFAALPRERCRYARPGHSAEIHAGETRLGLLGELHPRVRAAYGLKQTAFVFEIGMEDLTALAMREKVFEPLPKFPAVERDITVIVDRHVAALDVVSSVGSQKEELVASARLLGVYQGRPIPDGKKSVTFRVTYRSPVKTLEDSVVNELHETITARLVKAFDAGLPV